MDRRLADLDMSSIIFPSDKVTIADLRKLRPYAFDHGFDGVDNIQPVFFLEPLKSGQSMDTLGDLLFLERCAVAVAYARAEGIAPPDCEFIDMRELLKEKYVRLKLSSGILEAEELVRDLESQAARLSQAKGR
ncbi:hypothetical protein [Anatilimnocola floriformis]|uniref:hypothetical protein n=1 Tax=Anatilimnocola floriformis TaxID=2948575 RepID=UPI0020C4612E|nr:hypothetical protein [Anatilimnocola floriformis]